MDTRKPYPSDLTDREWSQVRRFIPTPKPGGRPAKYERREVVNALVYLNRTGCQWRALPHDLPPGTRCTGTSAPGGTTAPWTGCTTRCAATCGPPRAATASPPRRSSTASRSRRRKKGARGYDAGKKVAGRKRHILVDTLGLILAVVVHSADVQDRDGAKLVLRGAPGPVPAAAADLGRRRPTRRPSAGSRPFGRLAAATGVVEAGRASGGFVVLPRRWVVERTFGWLGRCRRLPEGLRADDREQRGDGSGWR